MFSRALVSVLLVFILGACSEDPAPTRTASTPGESTKATSPSEQPRSPQGEPTPTEAKSPSPGPSPGKERPRKEKPVEVRFTLVSKVEDAATADFEEMTEATLVDPRGWERAGFDLVLRERARFRVVLAEGAVVDRLCLPYETYGTYSCQNGPVVALNADRWRSATPKWTGTLTGYKRMLVNHEFGHLLGQHHPEVQCPQPGTEAPIMAQQSTELNGCLPNPWPLPHEIKRAARHDLPIAPGYGE